MEIKKVGIIGCGAIGVMYGKHLVDKLGSEDVFFIADEGRAAKYRGEGIYCNGEPCDFTYRTPTDALAADLVIFAVKATGLSQAIETARPFVGGDTIVLSALNGISSEQLLTDAYGERHVIYACIQGMDAVKQGNKATYHHMGYIAIGNKDGQADPRVDAVAEFFARAGMDCRIPDDIIRMQWSKLMLNCGVNQVTAAYHAPYAKVQEEGEAREMMVEAMKEVKRVAKTQGIALSDEDIDYWVSLIDSLNPEGYTSMCQDVLAGRKTEVELFSGTVVRLAKEAGIKLPVNEYLYKVFTENQESRLPDVPKGPGQSA